MALTWTTTDRLAQENGVKVLAYGAPGVGKTRAIITAPRPVIASAEGGTLSIADYKVPTAEILNYADLIDFYSWSISSTEAKNYDTLCLDSLSEIAERVLADERKHVKDARQAYGEMSDKIVAAIRNFRGIPGKHVYFTSKQETRKLNGLSCLGPTIPGAKASEGISYHFDEVFYVAVGTYPNPTVGKPPVSYSYFATQAHQDYEAKDRSGKLEAIEEPNLKNIFAKIQKANTQQQ